ncbi:putative secreted protein (Por secretion system target) [Lutibacter sp. Hel_I_33_5]|uniref:T9SS type A sorting domain-containing protein n=1 Tax=Lutibacter sp. Hel_I_33_5 TaxID=1566289 RepID=UPI0011AA558E|nr:T9SS type A sorting domain-containing protein [Lutibacter sp. Hel_I_33_5]TVZ56418.1 putative secreted protein (Por secretion system target) [Lutibacter sp. Hel_I_33_5]
MKLLIIILFTITTISATNQNRNIAILDMSLRNSETNDSNLFSAEHILKVTGIQYIIKESLIESLDHAIIFCSSEINSKSFSDDEKLSLIDYVAKGGVLITPRMLDADLFSLFNISSFSSTKTNHTINWSKNLSTKNYNWMDDDYEKQISLGDKDLEKVIKTYSYIVDTATSLGTYNNGTTAAFKSPSGKGFTYSFGVSWKDVILRNQFNRDYEAQRTNGNGFEPTQDVFILFIRSIAKEHIQFLTWKHTSPGNSTSTLMITHDVDSSSGMDMMSLFADTEREMNINSNFNITVRYFSDALNSDFYNNRETEINNIINKGHSIGSHSVGHFPDFASSSIFPEGKTGNTKENYTPYNDGKSTENGSVFGECEVSKNMLEKDYSLEIKSFRSGHLAYNNYLINVLDSLGYSYNSSNNANDVLTHFPYQNKMNRSFSGKTSKVYEIPVTISDIFKETPITENNYINKVAVWLDVLKKTDANEAPAVLLIHPNRNYKLEAQKLLLSKLPEGMFVEELNVFGDYWKARETIDITTEISNNMAFVTVSDENKAINNNVSFIINDGQELEDVFIADEDGNSINFLSKKWKTNDLLFYKKDVLRTYLTSSLNVESTPSLNDLLRIFPNPIKDELHIEVDLKHLSKLQIVIRNIQGKTVYKSKSKDYSSGLQHINLSKSTLNIVSGIYFCTLKTGENGSFMKKIIVK